MWGRKDQSARTGDGVTEFKSLLVPVDGSAASLRAVEFACSLARRNKGRVHVVHVIEVRRSLPLDAELVEDAARGEQILDDAEQTAKRQGLEIEGDLLQARDAGHAIVDEASERAVDAIIMGVPNRRPFGDFEMGKVSAHVLKTAKCEVVVLRMPMEV